MHFKGTVLGFRLTLTLWTEIRLLEAGIALANGSYWSVGLCSDLGVAICSTYLNVRLSQQSGRPSNFPGDHFNTDSSLFSDSLSLQPTVPPQKHKYVGQQNHLFVPLRHCQMMTFLSARLSGRRFKATLFSMQHEALFLSWICFHLWMISLFDKFFLISGLLAFNEHHPQRS